MGSSTCLFCGQQVIVVDFPMVVGVAILDAEPAGVEGDMWVDLETGVAQLVPAAYRDGRTWAPGEREEGRERYRTHGRGHDDLRRARARPRIRAISGQAST